jgi:uncharacterized protein DUF6152
MLGLTRKAPLKSKAALLVFGTIALLTLCRASSAHHGLAAYDMSKAVTVKGTVTEFDFANPHSAIYLDVKNDKGNLEKWLVEADSPNNLARAGWTRNSIKPGEQIAVVGNRAKDGSKLLRLQKVIFADGKQLKPREGDEY